MKKWRSLFMGMLLALVAVWCFTGTAQGVADYTDYAIFADEKIIIRNDAYVVGDVGTNGEDIQIKDNAVIFGNQDFGTGIELTPVELPSGGTPIDLVISDFEEVILREEDSPYRLDRIFIDKLAKATIEGNVTLYVEGKTEVRGSGQIVVMTDPPSSLTIYSGGDVEFRNSAVINQGSGELTIYGTQGCAKVIVRNDAIVKGVIDAPNAFLDMRDRVIIYGSVAGKKAEVRGTTKVYAEMIVFVTSTVYDGNLGGLAGADLKCQTCAVEAGLPGIFKAWLSDSSMSASDRLTHSPVPYVRVDGAVVADNWDYLIRWVMTPLDAAINVTELGTTIEGLYEQVWTGTHNLGFPYGGNCLSWTNGTNSANGRVGNAHWEGYQWTNNEDKPCDTQLHLYCFQQ